MMSDYSWMRGEHYLIGLHVCKGGIFCIHYCRHADCPVADNRSKSAELYDYTEQIASVSLVRIDADLLRFNLFGENYQSESSSTKYCVELY